MPEAGGALLAAFAFGVTANDRYIAALGSDSGSAGNTLFAIKTSTLAGAGDLGVFVGNSAIAEYADYSGLAIGDGKLHVAIVSVSRFGSSGGYERRVWLDGALIEDTADATNLGSGNTFNWVCAGGVRRTTDIAASANALNFLTVGFRRHLTVAEGMALTAEPWQLFERRIWVPVSAAPAGPTVQALTPTTIGSTSHRPRYTWTPA